MILLQARVDLRMMVMKGYVAFHNAPALLDPYHQIVLCHNQDTRWGNFTPLQKSSWCTLQPQAAGQLT